MGLISKISFRNLLRQKRRNLFLGIGIAFGMMILVVANSFSHGMVDVLIQDILAHVCGHLTIQATPGNSQFAVIRDKERIERIIYESIKSEDIVELSEMLGTFGTAVGRGESDNIMLIGINYDTPEERKEFFQDFFTLVEGDFARFYSEEIEYPVIISQEKAQSLNVGVNDILRVRVTMITGQIQAEQCMVVAVANANNSLMNIVVFMDGKRLKKLLGYQPWESAGMQILLKDPKRTVLEYADTIHKKLEPRLLSIPGRVNQQEALLLAFKNTEEAQQGLRGQITVFGGEQRDPFKGGGVLISRQLAAKLHLKENDKFAFVYPTKFRGLHRENLEIAGIFTSNAELGGDVILVNEERIHNTFNRYLPEDHEAGPTKEDPIYEFMATEWKLLDRSNDYNELTKQLLREREIRTDQTKFSIMTMYETANEILKLEGAINLITVIAVLILFFIILIGVMNTLRMTVKERTREIGTVRAIGMQKKDVRNMFLFETLYLTIISCMVGTVMGFIVIKILEAVTFGTNSFLSIILKNKRLFFKTNPLTIGENFLLILFIAGLTAFFPAEKAANLSAVEALRKYE